MMRPSRDKLRWVEEAFRDVPHVKDLSKAALRPNPACRGIKMAEKVHLQGGPPMTEAQTKSILAEIAKDFRLGQYKGETRIKPLVDYGLVDEDIVALMDSVLSKKGYLYKGLFLHEKDLYTLFLN